MILYWCEQSIDAEEEDDVFYSISSACKLAMKIDVFVFCDKSSAWKLAMQIEDDHLKNTQNSLSY